MTLKVYFKKYFYYKYITSINVFIIDNNWYNCKMENGWIVGKL